MASWREFETAEPAFAARIKTLLQARKHKTMATLRKDGSPRISGTETQLEDGQLRIGIMPNAARVFDLRRDPRIAIHSPTVDPPSADGAGWPGEAKISGVAIEDDGGGREDGSHRFDIDILEAAITSIGDPPDHLVIESWHPGRGLETKKRF